MIITVDLNTGASVVDPGVFTAFHASSTTTDNQAVGAAMGPAGYAADDAGHVWVSSSWIRQTVAGDGDWAAGFDAMVEFAASKGWMNDERTHIKAHVELA